MQLWSLHSNTGLVHTHYVIVLKLELNVHAMRHGMDGFGSSYIQSNCIQPVIYTIYVYVLASNTHPTIHLLLRLQFLQFRFF